MLNAGIKYEKVTKIEKKVVSSRMYGTQIHCHKNPVLCCNEWSSLTQKLVPCMYFYTIKYKQMIVIQMLFIPQGSGRRNTVEPPAKLMTPAFEEP